MEDQSNTDEEQEIINKCLSFAAKADSLESKGFHDINYQDNGFISDFDSLFEEYGSGRWSRTQSGLNFRKPARYSNIHQAVSSQAVRVNKNKYEVYFLGDRPFKTIKFTLKRIEGEWKLINYFTSLTVEPRDISDYSWRKHRL